jgi:flavin-binding protein dodecin
MPDKIYTIVDVVGVSEDNIHQKTIRIVLTKAGQTPRNIDSFEVNNTRNGLDGSEFWMRP